MQNFCAWKDSIKRVKRQPTEQDYKDFPGRPVVKNPPYDAEDAGLIPGKGTKIPHATGQLSPRATTTELARQLESLRATARERKPATTTREKPAYHNEKSHVLQLRPNTANK